MKLFKWGCYCENIKRVINSIFSMLVNSKYLLHKFQVKRQNNQKSIFEFIPGICNYTGSDCKSELTGIIEQSNSCWL